nr:suppressor of disruption of TFIIS [Ipomoea batatas]
MAYEDCFGQVQRLKYDCLLFDFMVEKLGIDRSKTIDLGHLLYKNYGTTLAGLRAIGYDFDYDEFHSFVHGRLPYENLRPDPVLRSLLISLPYRKLIFTNADKVHAIKVLRILGLEDYFEGIICFETLNPTYKTAASDDDDDIAVEADELPSLDVSGAIVEEELKNQENARNEDGFLCGSMLASSMAFSMAATEGLHRTGILGNADPVFGWEKCPAMSKISERVEDAAAAEAAEEPTNAMSSSSSDAAVL